jgi:hypothetical protein
MHSSFTKLYLGLFNSMVSNTVVSFLKHTYNKAVEAMLTYNNFKPT